MNRLRIGLLAAVSGSLLIAAHGAGATDESAVKASLPESVGRAIETEFPGGKIEKAKKGNEGAVAVDLSFREKMVEVDVMEDGTILKTEEVADIDAIPVPALKAILKAS